MKKLIFSLFAIFLCVQIWAQSTPVGEFRVANRTTSFGFNYPAGSKIWCLSDSTYWAVKDAGVLGSNNLNTAIASHLVNYINKTETDPIVRAIHGVVKSDGTTISRVKSGVDIVTINGDSLLKTGDIPLITQAQLTTQLGTKIDTSQRGAANGVASLVSGKVPLSQINDVLLGSVNYKGTWSPLTKTPTLPAAATDNKGWYYVATDDSTYLGTLYKNKDWIVSNGTAWQKVDNNNLLASVFGRAGNVVATTGDYNADQIIETASRVFITPAQKTVLSNTSGTNTGDNAVNSLYSGLVTNATHTGDATGATALTLATVNANVGTYNNVTINAKGLATAGSNTAYWYDGSHPTTTAGYGLPDYPTTVTAANITGVLAVPKGGTGNSVITPGSIPQGNDVNPTSERTLDQLKMNVGAADMDNYSTSKIETFAEAAAGSTGQDNVLANFPSASTAVQVSLNGSVLEPGKYTLTNKTVKVTIPVYQYDKVVVTYAYDYSGDAKWADKWYGVERDITSTSADWTRIGNLALHQTTSLPVQSLLKGVVLNANRTVNYYLYPTDWTKKADGVTASVLTGADGNVMVRKDAPTYWKFEQVGNIQRVKCSTYPIPGFLKFDIWNVGAYEANIYNTKLSSIKGVLPTTSRSLTQFRADARANGAGYNQMWNDPWNEIVWMFVVEYATSNIQKAVAADAGGLRQGGLGDGVTTAVSAEWSAYNGYNPFITCGASDILANGSGQVSVTITNFGGAGINRSFNVPRYRGIENLYGHIWKWVDGKSFNHTATASEVWIFDNPDLIADNTSVGARYAGNLPSASGYITNVIFGARGETLPLAVGGDPSTYFTDYFWTPGLGTGWRALFSGAAADFGANAGCWSARTYYGAGDASTSIGARLTAR